MDTQHSPTQLGDDRPVVIPSPRPELPELVERPDPLGPPTAVRPGVRRRAVLAGVAAGILVAAALGAWLASQGDGDSGVQAKVPPAAQPAGPAPLSLEVTAPATQVVAGQAATFEVRWADGAGTFSGSTEEWGDDVGASSLQEGRCDTATASDAATSGSYAVTHTWMTPGTYTVKLGVSSYTCTGGAAGDALVENAEKTLTVVVAAG